MKPGYVDSKTNELQMKVEQEQENYPDGKKSLFSQKICHVFLSPIGKMPNQLQVYLTANRPI